MKTMIIYLISVMMFASFATSQEKIEGRVTDESGNVLPGVNVQEKGTTNGTVTDINGDYVITVQNKNAVLTFSCIGYRTEDIKVENKSKIDVTLVPEIMSLEEIVVVEADEAVHSDLTGQVKGITIGRNEKRHVIHHFQPYFSAAQATVNINTESYASVSENNFHQAHLDPLSTFSIDVDAASYSNVRRFINSGQLPPKDAVRVEEMINYFSYDYPLPEDEVPFSIYAELAECPWRTEHKLLHIGLQGKQIINEELPKSNLVFLIDVSGSMNASNKLPLLKSSFKLLVNQLRPEDRVAIVVYAGAAGEVLPSTSGRNKQKILEAINSLNAGGSTAGGAGIKLAYSIAEKNFIKNGNNRIILATDGDFNVGASSDKEMETLIEEKRESGIFLTCLGYGMGNYKDSKMEILADKGNGNYAYIDNIQEANRVLVSEFSGTMYTIAKDVKIQIEFNPSNVSAYRLIGYENRLLADEDFKDDTKDAGELGAGHTVTALYEIIPAGVESNFIKDVDPLKYQRKEPVPENLTNEMVTVKLRYKEPDGKVSKGIVTTVPNSKTTFTDASENFRFSAAVAMVGMILSKSRFMDESHLKDAVSLAHAARGKDEDGYRAEFVRLAKIVDQQLEGLAMEEE